MARRPRVVIPGIPHHVTQRGNDRQPVFYSNANRSFYLSLLARHSARYGMEVLGYCLMKNHVHLIAVPEREDSLARTFARTHSEYTASVNRTRQRTGHLWQNRFFSCPMSPTHVDRALLYVDMNPVRAGLVAPWDWLWSSARTHTLRSCSDPVMNERWEEYQRGSGTARQPGKTRRASFRRTTSASAALKPDPWGSAQPSPAQPRLTTERPGRSDSGAMACAQRAP